ncbi:MAG: phospho-N-acetylmuramoyl-pentapeptide-transferase [Bacteroidales bacterium]|nr:phospho-N-acetylmuramoyl-pentapeptide-transferase [Bacteroidales bacterium]
MFYHLFQYLEGLHFPGAGVFQYISFRAAVSMITSLIIAIWFGKWFIKRMKKSGKTEIEETRTTMNEAKAETALDCDNCANNIKNLKKNVPTMGGLIIIAAIVVPTLLFAQLNNVYTFLMLVTTLWLGCLGFIDDFLKQKKHNKDGLSGKFKLLGQILLGFFVGAVLYFSPDAVIRERVATNSDCQQVVEVVGNSDCSGITEYSDVKSTKTTIPFFKNNELDYRWFVAWAGDYADDLAWLVFIVMTILVVTAVSNGANLTDGLDGLATGTSAIIGATLGILAYVSGNRISAEYLNILYIPNSGELMVFAAAFMGATIGFLWYNTYPAQVFMGDTGSLTLGGIIAVFAIIIKKELILPILCGIFLVESLSVIIQNRYCIHYRKKHNLPKGVAVPVEKRPFRMAPLHHHYQKLGMPESRIVARFWIVTLLLAIVSIVTLKLR